MIPFVGIAQESSSSLTPVFQKALQLKRVGDLAGAEREAKRAIEMVEKQQGPESVLGGHMMLLLSSIYFANSKFLQASILQRKVIKIYEGALDNAHPNFISAINNLALSYRELGQYEQAIQLFQKSLDLSEAKKDKNNDENIAATTSNLAVTYSYLAKYDIAIHMHQHAVELYEKNFGLEDARTATGINNLAEAYRLSGEFGTAVKLHQKVLAIRERLLGREHIDVAISLSNLASIRQDLGQYQAALLLYKRAARISEKRLGINHLTTARLLSNVGTAFSNLGRLPEAILQFNKAIKIQEMLVGASHPDIAHTLSFIGDALAGMGQYDEAKRTLKRSAAILELFVGSIHPDLANTLLQLSSVFGLKREYDGAIDFAKQALFIRIVTLGDDHPVTSSGLSLTGSLYNLMGQQELAIPLLKQAVNNYQVVRNQVSRIGARELHAYTQSISHSYQTLASILVDEGRLSEAQEVLDMLKEDEQFEFIRRASDADPRSSRIGYTGTEQVWLKRYREIAGQLGKLGAEQRELEKQAKLGLTPEQKQRQQAIAADLNVAQSAFQSYLGEMREGLAQKGQARKVEVEEVSAQAMRESQSLIKGLGDDVALLQYYITDKRVGMMLTTPSIQLARNSAIDSKELNRKIGEFRRLLQDPKSNPVAAAQELYRILVAPVEKDLKEAKINTVMLSLDGALRYLPFGALHDGKQYLVNRWNLPMYTSVTKNRLRDAVSPEWQAAGLGVTKAWPEFKPLAGVQAEMGAIVKTATGGFMPGEVYLDEAFTASRLKDVGQRKFPLMHVASHFRFSPGTEVNSFLLLGDGEHLTLGDIRTQNYRFDNVDLLTLSACDTGLGGGRDEQGKEIEGFGVIAQQQGAKAVLATLWPVADESTATLMADLYRRRQSDSLTKIEALRQSQIAMRVRTKYAHPYYWAPFILMGNWK